MSVEKKVPEIRFKGFSGEWDSRCLGSLCLIGDIDHRMPESKTTGIPYLMTGDFCGINGLNFESAKLISIEDYEQLSKKIKPEYGDIIFARYASVGAVRYIETEINFLISYSCAILKTSNTSYGKYLFYFFQTNRTKNQIELDINTGSQRNIGIDSLKNLLVALPKSEEQTAIANYFQQLDSLIHQHQQKHDKLNNIKKAMLEKMFPKPGATVPEIRFKEFSGKWNYLALGENAKFTKGQGYSKSDLVTNGSPIILYGQLYTKYQTVITAVDTFVTEKNKSVKSIGGEVIVPASGESPEDISRASVVSEPNVILGGDLNIVLPNKKINSTFLALAISNGRLKKMLSSKAQGKSVVHIRNSDLSDLVMILPTEITEQTAIGNYFQKLDTLLNQHQQQISKLNTIKQACLSKMFV